MSHFFPFGARITDPSSTSGTKGNERYRLNANISHEDEETLKLISLDRGTIQLVTASLIHSLCQDLRTHGITNRLHLDAFHIMLAAYAGWEVDFSCADVREV